MMAMMYHQPDYYHQTQAELFAVHNAMYPAYPPFEVNYNYSAAGYMEPKMEEASFPYSTTMEATEGVRMCGDGEEEVQVNEQAVKNVKDNTSLTDEKSGSNNDEPDIDGNEGSDAADADQPNGKKKKRRRRKNKTRKDPRADPNYWINAPSATECCIVPVDEDPLPLALIASM